MRKSRFQSGLERQILGLGKKGKKVKETMSAKAQKWDYIENA